MALFVSLHSRQADRHLPRCRKRAQCKEAKTASFIRITSNESRVMRTAVIACQDLLLSIDVTSRALKIPTKSVPEK